MVDYSEKIKDIENELKKTSYNKRTQHHIGLIKAKLARLKDVQSKRSKSRPGEGYSVKKSGDATVVILGFPSVGKSTLLNSITDAKSKVGAYDFTTLTVIPGLLEYEDAKIQILDMPGIVHGAASGRGRGREVLSVMRGADLILILVDVNHPEHYEALKKEIYESGIRTNQQPPDVKIIKKSRDGISIGSTVKLAYLDDQTITGILKEFKINNADVLIRQNITIDQLIDVIEKNKVYIPSLTILTKIDMVSEERLQEIIRLVNPDLCVSAEQNIGLDLLKEMIFKKLNFIRIYCKQVGKKADLEVPLIMKRNCTIQDVCEKLHRDFVSKFRFAKIWGSSAKFPGQRFKLNHILLDKDVIQLHIK